MNKLEMKNFQIEELEERLEMAKWTASASTTQKITPSGRELSSTQSISVSWGK